MTDSIWPPVLSGDRRLLAAADDLLQRHRIASRHGTPKREGLLRVATADAQRARQLLRQQRQFEAHIVDAGAAWYNCHVCSAELDGGETHCPRCGTYVRD